MLDPFQETIWPLGDQIEAIIDFIVDNFRFIFNDWIGQPVGFVLRGIQSFFLFLNPLVFLVALLGIGWQIAGRNIAIFSVIAMTVVGLIGAWEESMITLALVATAVVFCVIIGIPLGIWAARSDRFASLIRPILDTMQTLPAFVYLVPVVMLFGTGEVPGVIVTFIFAVPPLIRLTNIGIRGVPEDVVEAAKAFGSTPRQVLLQVQVPLAMPTILAGVNQSLMLALSMVVIASLIAVEGLGQMVNRGIGRLDVGLAAVGGIGIVLLAIVLDRITQAVGDPKKGQLHWKKRGPIGFVLNFLNKNKSGKIPQQS
ncbi:MAG: ABC transporter permease subunit [Cyanobacteria bacterium]|jgi:glycine betaine/proline transport system permease protein|nr:ABC transporter permease subunit [Cyanobacteria bacterium GSL.Bin21]